VERCALKTDLETLEDGDGTEIGVRYVTGFLDYECNRNDVIFFLGVLACQAAKRRGINFL
jgi:hypothetical protein